jgi:RimJ/RimL family protein N-acetyltransferase
MVQVPDRATARTILSPMSEKQQKTGYGRYMISLRDSSIDSSVPFSQRPHREYIGHVSVQMGRHPDAPTVPDVGFALLARYHGKGYATEATLRLIQHFRETRQQEAFAGYTAPDNDRSNLLFARIGFEDRGVKAVRGIVGDGSPFAVRVWGLGLKGELEEFGI